MLLNVAEAFTAICSWYLTTQEQAMNTFCEHHKNSIKFAYRCFDRTLLNGLIQPFQRSSANLVGRIEIESSTEEEDSDAEVLE
jgi:hypothetical protein